MLFNHQADPLAVITRGRHAIGETPLHRAMENKLFELFLRTGLIAEGDKRINFDNNNRDWETSMHIAAKSGFSIAVSTLAELGGDISDKNRHSQTPLDLAKSSGNHDTVDVLLEIFKNQKVANEGDLAVHCILHAVEYLKYPPHFPLERIEVKIPSLGELSGAEFRLLLTSFEPALFSKSGANGELPIHVACGTVGVHPGILQCLVEHGGVTTLAEQDEEGFLPLHCFLNDQFNPDYEAVKFLLDSHPTSSVHMKTHQGDSLLTLACKNASCSVGVVELLVKNDPPFAVAEIDRCCRRTTRASASESVTPSANDSAADHQEDADTLLKDMLLRCLTAGPVERLQIAREADQQFPGTGFLNAVSGSSAASRSDDETGNLEY